MILKLAQKPLRSGLVGFLLKRIDSYIQTWYTGKDYSNPRVSDFFTLDKPDEDMYDRTKIPRMPWWVLLWTKLYLCSPFVQAWCWHASSRSARAWSLPPFRPTVELSSSNQGELKCAVNYFPVWKSLQEPHSGHAFLAPSPGVQTWRVDWDGPYWHMWNANMPLCWALVYGHARQDRAFNPKCLFERLVVDTPTNPQESN